VSALKEKYSGKLATISEQLETAFETSRVEKETQCRRVDSEFESLKSSLSVERQRMEEVRRTMARLKEDEKWREES